MSAKKSSDPQAVVTVGDVPAHLIKYAETGEGAASLEMLKHHKILNRLDIVQSNSPKEKRDQYGEGSLFVPSTSTLVCKNNETVDFVPVMFFDEYIQWGDRDDKAGPMIRERSMDRASLLAAKCDDFKRMFEPYGDNKEFEARNVHHLNFLAVLYSGPLKGTLVVLSFRRGSYSVGTGLIGGLQSRRIQGRQAPIWSTVWTLGVVHKTKDGNEWWNPTVSPAESPWVGSPEESESLKAMHESLLKDYAEQRLGVGHEEAETAVGGEDDLKGEKRF